MTMKSEEIVIEINGKELKAVEGESILTAAEKNSIHIPTLCFEKGLSIQATCRICVVEVEGAKKLQPACHTPVYERIKIKTESKKVVEARREILRLLLANHDLRCLTCERNGDCRLQDLCYRYKVEDTPYLGDTKEYPLDRSNPFFIRDYGKCILCGKCVRICAEVNGAYVFDFMDRGFDTKVTSAFDEKLQNTTCTFCGMCVNVCPVGALVERSMEWKARPWEIDKVLTTCPYCGVGCQMYLKVYEGRIIGVAGEKDAFNQGHLCNKGQFGLEFVHSRERLKYPMIKESGSFRKATWEEALSLVVEKFSNSFESKGKEGIAGLSSAKVTNEENYLFQKILRSAFKTNHIDHCARLCHSSTVAGLVTAFGSGAMTNSINEILETDCIVVIGSNTTEAHPVTGYRIKQAKKKGAKIIVIDPRRIELVNYCDIWLDLRPGSNTALLSGLSRIIYNDGLYDKKFIEERTEGFSAWTQIIQEYTPARVKEITGISEDELFKAARIIGESKKTTFVYAMGITQHTSGTYNVLAVANLALLTGNIGKEGTGVAPLRGQNNVQGACDMGALPNYLPAYQVVDNDKVRKKFEAYWNTKLNPKAGLTVTEIIEKAGAREIECLYIMGENPAVSDPDAGEVRRSLENTEFLVVQDIFLTETAKLADVILPAACFAEKEGTFTNTERRVQRVRKAVEPPGKAKSDQEILLSLAKMLGIHLKGFSNKSAEREKAKDIMEEINELAPLYGGITYKRLEKSKDGLQWPCYDSSHPGTKFLHRKKFYRGRGRFHLVKYLPPAEIPSEEYPLTLMTGRWLYHFHTGSMSRRSKRLKWLRNEELAMINKEDAKKLDLYDGDIVKVLSRRGEIKTKIQITDHIPENTVFMTFHFPETLTNILTNKAKDPICKIPELKTCAVRVEKS